MDKKKGRGSHLFLKPLSKISMHIDTRRQLLGAIQLKPSSLSPRKHSTSKPTAKLTKSSSSYNIKPLLDLNLRASLNKSKELLSPLKLKQVISEERKLAATKSNILPSLLPKVILNIVHKSVTGMSEGKQKKDNQDAYFVIDSFAGVPNQILLGVMDGHGFYGNKVSNYVRAALPFNLEKGLRNECKN